MLECPRCVAKLGGAVAAGAEAPGEAPRLGDLSICVYCAALLEFVPGGYALLSEQAYAALPADTQQGLARAAEVVKQIARSGKRSVEH